MADVIDLGAHAHMTPEQALAVASREDWSHVLIVGFHKAEGETLAVRSSHMSREFSLWIAVHLQDYIKGVA